MCEETNNYLWATQDLLGHGATSQVYKAYSKATGELVAAKVYQVSSNSRSQQGGYPNYAKEKDFRPILDREMDVLKSADHENIVRYIALEPVKASDTSRVSSNREALFIEYCNGGSLHNVLELPENRFGLKEDEFMLVFKHLTNALKYLHDKNTIHRDIKPDNIMLSININGERTYKLADLGVARLINEGEHTFTSIVGTEEYIHPEIYRAVVNDNKSTILRSTLQNHLAFPFEVDLWSLGVTLYQCAAGELPFQPFAGTRRDRIAMKRILDLKPSGHISGIESTQGGEIQWSKTLPASCRLSSNLKHRLEILLQRLLESDRNQLMTFGEFFNETDRILNLMPIYYLNLKRFTLTCGYFEPTQSIIKLYDELHKKNGDENNEQYYCLFQNVPYPISETDPVCIKTFIEQLPIPTSRETPLVFYTFSSIPDNDTYSPKLDLPVIKPIRQHNDVAAACEWSKDIVGLFFHVRTQLVDYQNILKTAQCSTPIMQQYLKSKLLEFLCSIRAKLIVFSAVEELKNILDQIDMSTSGQTISTSRSLNSGNVSSNEVSNAPSIGFSHFLTDVAKNNDGLSSGNISRSLTTPSTRLIQQSIRIHLRSYLQPYEQLKQCEQDILKMIETEFNGQLNIVEDQQAYANSLWLSHHTKTYASWIQRTEKYLKDVNDLNESFRKDRLLSTYNRLQSDAHFRRRKNLEELYENYIHFATDECYPNLVQIFKEYNEWIKRRSTMIRNFTRIQQAYETQYANIMNYVEMIANFREVIHKNVRELSVAALSRPDGESNQPSHPNSVPSIETDHNRQLNLLDVQDQEENANQILVNKIRGTTKKTILNAEESLNKLDGVLKQLRTNMLKELK